MVRLVYFTLAIALAIGISAAGFQTDSKVSSKDQLVAGVVKAVSASSLTLERGNGKIVFGVDSSTRVISKGTSTDLLRRMPGPRLTDIVKAGDQVTVKYRLSGSARNAVEVRVLQK